jgi:hypothetical protein
MPMFRTVDVLLVMLLAVSINVVAKDSPGRTNHSVNPVRMKVYCATMLGVKGGMISIRGPLSDSDKGYASELCTTALEFAWQMGGEGARRFAETGIDDPNAFCTPQRLEFDRTDLALVYISYIDALEDKHELWKLTAQFTPHLIMRAMRETYPCVRDSDGHVGSPLHPETKLGRARAADLLITAE